MINLDRIHAQKQWNNLACGELNGDKDTLDYFLNVESERYKQQYWQKEYFQFSKFGNKKVLEIGIGQGTDLMQFARAGAICYGVDITDNHLVLTKRNFNLQNFKVEIFKNDATDLPFEDNSLDCVYSFGVLHHIQNADKVSDEIYRVLKPGGCAMVALYHKCSAFHFFRKLLYQGIRSRDLFKLGYDGLLSTIETGADGKNIKPYVKLYTKRSIKSLFSKFICHDVSVRQLYWSHFWSFNKKYFGNLSQKRFPFESYLGWYVTFKGIKD